MPTLNGPYTITNYMRNFVQPLLNMFHSEPGNGLWKRKADAALRHCKVKREEEITLVNHLSSYIYFLFKKCIFPSFVQ